MLRAVIFDFDYTLGDTTDGIAAAFNYAFEKMGLPARPADEIRKTVGLTLEDSFAILTGDRSADAAEGFVKHFQTAAVHTLAPSAKLYPRTLETLDFFRSRGCSLGIVTTKRRAHIVSIFDKFGITNLFGVIVGEDNVKNAKPDPEGLLSALDALGVKGSDVQTNALYIGDSFVDGQTAQNACVPFAAVTTGSTSREKLLPYSPLVIADEIGGIADFVRKQK